jgi:lactonase
MKMGRIRRKAVLMFVPVIAVLIAACGTAGVRVSTGNSSSQGSGGPRDGLDRDITLVATPFALLEPPSAANARPFAEAPRFDRNGTLYWVSVGGDAQHNKLFKLNLTTRKSTPIYHDATSVFSGIAIHKDGTLYLADLVNGKVAQMNPDGSNEHDVVTNYQGAPVYPDDLVFDKNGNLYFTSFDGSLDNLIGGVYRLSTSTGQLTRVTAGLARPNGISLSPDQTQLWVGELQANRVDRIGLTPDGTMDTSRFSGYVKVAANLNGAGSDSNTVDSAGNVYQAELSSGELEIINPFGKLIGRVDLPGLPTGDSVSNVVVKPGGRDAYVTTGGADGSHLYRFQALAPGQIPYSHQ